MRIQDGDEGYQMPHAHGVHGGALFRGQLVRSDVGACGAHPDQGAVVGHVVVAEEVFRRAEGFRKQPPQAAAAHFRTRAVKPLHGAFGVGVFRPAHFFADVHPVDDGVHFSEGYARLGHAEGAGIHAQEKVPFFTVSVFQHVLFVRYPCVGKRVVGEVYGISEPEPGCSVPEVGRGVQNGGCGGVHAFLSWSLFVYCASKNSALALFVRHGKISPRTS